jgi:hypothetical protein
VSEKRDVQEPGAGCTISVLFLPTVRHYHGCLHNAQMTSSFTSSLRPYFHTVSVSRLLFRCTVKAAIRTTMILPLQKDVPTLTIGERTPLRWLSESAVPVSFMSANLRESTLQQHAETPKRCHKVHCLIYAIHMYTKLYICTQRS